MKVKLISYTRLGENIIAAASKQTISKRPVQPSELTDSQVSKWIKELFRRQHWSPLEFSEYTFLVEGISRVASHQLVRHRIASYCQLSQRYSEGLLRNLVLRICREKGIECPEKPTGNDTYLYYSIVVRDATHEYMNPEKLISIVTESYVIPPYIPIEQQVDIAYKYLDATATYYQLLSQGVAKEDARFVLPQAIKTIIYVKMNARELVTSFLPLRMCSRAQWEIRKLAWKMYNLLVKVHPRIFMYAGPRCVLLENTFRNEPIPLKKLLTGEENFTIPRCPELVMRDKIRECIVSHKVINNI